MSRRSRVATITCSIAVLASPAFSQAKPPITDQAFVQAQVARTTQFAADVIKQQCHFSFQTDDASWRRFRNKYGFTAQQSAALSKISQAEAYVRKNKLKTTDISSENCQKLYNYGLQGVTTLRGLAS